MAKTLPPVYTFDWLAQADPALYARVQAAGKQPLNLSLRVNTLKCAPESAMQKWAEIYGWQYESVPYCSSGFWVKQAETAPSSTIEHRLGYSYIQEAASMLPAELFDFSNLEQPLILDMAASPGGKTIHLVDRSRDHGFIVANDASRGRISALRIVLQNWGAINQAVTCLPGEWFGAYYPETFDAVLLDAPCSMQGLRASESHKARTITLTEVEALAERQARLLESALQAVKVGGQVVYSTCTLTPQEDEGVLAALLEKFPACFEISDISSSLPQPAAGLAEFNGSTFPREVRNAARLWPQLFNTAGFFAARLTKTEPLRVSLSAFNNRAARPPQMTVPLPVETRGICDHLSGQYGFDLAKALEENNLQVVEIDGQLCLAGKALNARFYALPWLSSGMPLGKTLPEGWQPSHEFVSRFGDRFTRNVLTLEDEHLPAWMRGEDLRGYATNPELRGEVVAVRDALGRNLGRAKLLENRLKNLLPTRLF
jgi:16S rRNA (cytosine1407-C5)-methyltransferase